MASFESFVEVQLERHGEAAEDAEMAACLANALAWVNALNDSPGEIPPAMRSLFADWLTDLIEVTRRQLAETRAYSAQQENPR